MPYTKTNWVDKTPTNSGTPVNAANMNKIEQGIEAAWDKISEVYKGEITAAEIKDTKESGMYKVISTTTDMNDWLWVSTAYDKNKNLIRCQQLRLLAYQNQLWHRSLDTETNSWLAWESYAYTSDLLPILQDIVNLQEEKLNKAEAHQTFANAIIGTASGETVTLSDVQEGTSARTLTIYGETTEIGEGEKSPTNPYELVGVENPVVRVSGKNLFNKSAFTNPSNWTTQPETREFMRFIIKIKPNTQYRISRSNYLDPVGKGVLLKISDYAYTTTHAWLLHYTAGVSYPDYIGVSDSQGRICFYARAIDLENPNFSLCLGDFQLELGTTATEYEPFQGYKTYPITTPPLYSLPDGTKDTIDIVSGARTNNVGVAVLSAGTTWTIPEAVDNSPIICTISNITNLIGKTLTIPEGATEDFTVLYKLATPTTSELSPQTIPLYSPTTIISTDKGSLEIEYNRDINTALTEGRLDPAMFVPRVNTANRVYTTSATGQQETKPLSDFATASDVANKVDKVEGKGLSTEDYTTEEKEKLAKIEENANNFIVNNAVGIKDKIVTGVILLMKDENGYYMRADGLGNHMLCYSENGYFAFPLDATVV
jgi:hypothetical protein